jgi:hypothetical protein
VFEETSVLFQGGSWRGLREVRKGRWIGDMAVIYFWTEKSQVKLECLACWQAKTGGLQEASVTGPVTGGSRNEDCASLPFPALGYTSIGCNLIICQICP